MEYREDKRFYYPQFVVLVSACHPQQDLQATKGNPNLLNKSINLPSVWREFGPIPKNGGHPAPFTPALPKMILKAVGKPGDTILDPFGGSMTTCLVASTLGYKSIGVDIAADYVEQARALFQA